MNSNRNKSNVMAAKQSLSQSPSSWFTSLPQAIGCANQFFMEGHNVQIIARDKNSFLVVSPETARQMFTKGFKLLYGN